MSETLNQLWEEKYRPKTLDDFVGSEKLVAKMRKSIENNDIDNLLFYGPPGTGKTTLAMIIANNIDADVKVLNGSDERGIDTVRDIIINFSMAMSFKKFKIVFYNEIDYLTPAAQAILRQTTEEYSDHTRYLATCNYKDKLTLPLLSRFQCYEIKPLDMKQIGKRILHIIQEENIQIKDKNQIIELVKNCYPDIRKTIKTLEKCTNNGIFELDEREIISDSYKTKLIELLNNKASFEILRKLIIDSSITDYNLIYKLLFDCIEEYCQNTSKIPYILMVIEEHMYRNTFVVDKEITLSTCILKILEHLKK